MPPPDGRMPEEEKKQSPQKAGGSRKRRWTVRRIAFAVLAALVLSAVALAVSAPAILVRCGPFCFSYDLASDMPDGLRKAFTNTLCEISVSAVRHGTSDFAVSGSGRILDFPFTLDVRVDYSILRLSAAASGKAVFCGDGPEINFDAQGSCSGGWSLAAEVPEFEIAADDSSRGSLFSRLVRLDREIEPGSASLSGRVRGAFSAASANAVPQARADLWVAGADAAARRGGSDLSVDGLSVHAAAELYGERFSVKPLFPRARAISYGPFALTNAFASVRATESAYLVTEAGADVCGGKARIYSLFLRPDKLHAGFTLLLDDIDAGAALACLAGFEGEATGRLHGKLPVRYSPEKGISFGGAYLHSFPGETGRIAVRDPEAFAATMSLAGVPDGESANAAKALANLEYDVLRIDLSPGDGGDGTLSFKLQGKSKSGRTEVPVVLNVNLHGDLAGLLNTGLDIAGKGKAK